MEKVDSPSPSRQFDSLHPQARTMAVEIIEERKKKEADLKAMSERFDNIVSLLLFSPPPPPPPLV